MTEMFGEAWSPMSVPDLAPDDDDDYIAIVIITVVVVIALEKSASAVKICRNRWRRYVRSTVGSTVRSTVGSIVRSTIRAVVRNVFLPPVVWVHRT